MNTIEALEAEADRRRADFTKSLGQVRRKLTPLGLADEALRLIDPQKQVIAAAGQSVRRNPLPAISVLLGLSWLVLNTRQPNGPKPKRIKRKPKSLIAAQTRKDDYDENS
jgi:hypothetical protein